MICESSFKVAIKDKTVLGKIINSFEKTFVNLFSNSLFIKFNGNEDFLISYFFT